MNDLRRLLSYAKPHAGALALGILLTSVVGLFEAARIALVAPIFDGLASQKVPSSLSIFDIRAYVDIGRGQSWSIVAGAAPLFLTSFTIVSFFFSYPRHPS